MSPTLLTHVAKTERARQGFSIACCGFGSYDVAQKQRHTLRQSNSPVPAADKLAYFITTLSKTTCGGCTRCPNGKKRATCGSVAGSHPPIKKARLLHVEGRVRGEKRWRIVTRFEGSLTSCGEAGDFASACNSMNYNASSRSAAASETVALPQLWCFFGERPRAKECQLVAWGGVMANLGTLIADGFVSRAHAYASTGIAICIRASDSYGCLQGATTTDVSSWREGRKDSFDRLRPGFVFSGREA